MIRSLLALSALLFTAFAGAQPATPAQKEGANDDGHMAIVHFETKLGSFKIINGVGRLEFTFKGTVLLNRVKGWTRIVTGNVRKEYEGHDREVYTGEGKVVVTGEWRGVQWYGSDMEGYWFGHGSIRLSGEFDRNQDTGLYWFEDATRKDFWPGGSTFDLPVPPVTPGYNPNVKVRKKG